VPKAAPAAADASICRRVRRKAMIIEPPAGPPPSGVGRKKRDWLAKGHSIGAS
jgi:hypothetical protein